MTDLSQLIFDILTFVLPLWVGNAAPTILGGGPPIDGGRLWKDGKRILGDGKTWRGLFSGAFIGMTAGFGLSVGAKYLGIIEFDLIHLNDFKGFPLMIPIVFSLCFGALMGDITESFFKRRVGKNRGEDWLVFDQLDFILGALILNFIVSTILYFSGLTQTHWFISNLSIWHILVLLIVTPFFHLFANFIHKASKPKPRKIN